MTYTRLTLVLLVLLVSRVPLTAAAEAAKRIPYAEVESKERVVLRRYLDAADWPIRVFGLLRLERYDGPEIEPILRRAAGDEAWPVRCFAIRAAMRQGVQLTAADLPAEETEPRVIRAALRAGIELDEERVERVGLRLLRSRTLDTRLLGLEIAAASKSPKLRAQGARRIVTFIDNIEPMVLRIAGPRIARMYHLDPAPLNLAQWRAWAANSGGRIRDLPLPTKVVTSSPPSIVAEMDVETFNRLLDYLDVLRQRTMDIALVMDSTASMRPMIDEARVGVDSLILFFNDIARSMRLAFIAYRDHDNEPVWEGEVFTADVEHIRRFLFEIRITGGTDLPEAVYDGLAACTRLDWNEDAHRQLILIGDARPHDTDMGRTLDLAGRFFNEGIPVHAIHIEMVVPRNAPYATPEYLAQISEHNRLTVEAFQGIAESGGGQFVALDDAHELVPTLMHTSIEEGWWTVFDEFYTLYRELCR